MSEKKSAIKGVSQGKTRASFIIKIDTLEKIRDIAHWTDTVINDNVDSVLSYYVEAYEKQNGKIKSRFEGKLPKEKAFNKEMLSGLNKPKKK
jgi:hypothetical protein